MSLVASASSSVWFKKKLTALSGQSIKIDEVNVNSFLFFEYKIALCNSAGTLVCSMILNGHKIGSQVVDKVSSKAGSGIDYEITASINSGSLEIDLQNNESFDLRVGFARILVEA